MAIKEYFKIDLETGNLLEMFPTLFDDEVDEIPSDYKLSWGGGLHSPRFDLTLDGWVEELTEDELLNIKRMIKLDELDDKCNQAIYGRFTYTYDDGNVYSFSCDNEAQNNFEKVDRAFEKGRMTDIDWTAYDSTGKVVRLNFTVNNFEGLYVAHLNHIQDNIKKLRDTLMPQVMQATEDELQNIQWDQDTVPA